MRPLSVRVALVGPFVADEARARGGVETAFRNLVQGLAAAEGVEPCVVTFANRLDRPERMSFDGAPVLRLPGTEHLGNVTLHARERLRLASALADLKPDVVHAQDALRYGYVSVKASRTAPVLVSVHGIVREELRYATGLTTRMRIRVAGIRMERHCVRKARLLLAPTRYAEEVFGDEIRGRLRDVGNPIAERFFAIEPDPERGRVLYAGGLTRGKRLLDLVEAVSSVSGEANAHLRVAGPPSDERYVREVRARIGELGIESRVTFLGGLGLDALADEYRRASVLVLPSGKETSPMVIGEAMAAAVPVIATRVGGIPHLVDHGLTGHIVAVGDTRALSERITRVLGDRDAQVAMGAAGRAKAEREFRIASVVGRVRAAYEEALSDR